VNKGFVKVSGFNDESLRNKNATLFMPQVIENVHAKLLANFIMLMNNSQISEKVMDSLWLKTKSQTIKHVSMRVMPRIDMN
jgi:hypothetical protein